MKRGKAGREAFAHRSLCKGKRAPENCSGILFSYRSALFAENPAIRFVPTARKNWTPLSVPWRYSAAI